MNFTGDDGNPLTVSAFGSSVTSNLAAQGTALIEIPNVGPLLQGYVSAGLPPGVTGYGVFRQSVPGVNDQEAVVPLSGITATTSTLLFDDTKYVTGVAVVNLGSVATTVTAIARDSQGNTIGTGSLSLPARGQEGAGPARPYPRRQRCNGFGGLHRAYRQSRRPGAAVQRRGLYVDSDGGQVGGPHSRAHGHAILLHGVHQPRAPFTGRAYHLCGDGHLITFAPTGTGKTSGPVICNALKHPGQLIVLDMKGEVHAATAQARRAMGQEVHVLDLRDDGHAGSLNPLDLMARCGTDPAAMARSFAAELIERGDERDRFWNDWSETMIAGGVSWLLADHPPEGRRLSALFDLFTNDDVTYQLAMLMDDKKKLQNRAARAAFAGFLQLSDTGTRPSVLGTVQTHLRLFDSDLMRRLTDTSSIDIDALIAGEPMSLYIIVPPFRLTAYSPLLRAWLSGLILAMTQRKTQPKERTLMLCDEIGNLGKLDALVTAATLLRSWGLTLWTFWQNVAQLQIYGAQANTLVDNAGVVQVFGARNQRMAQDLANIIGGVSAEEILRMPKDEQILLIEGKLIAVQAGPVLRR